MPLALINQVSAARCEWLVPGLLAEKVQQLLKTLPQKIRRHCVPVPEFAAAFCREVQPSDTPLLQALARYIREQKQLDVPLDAFRLEQLPPHLLMNFRVVDEHGRQLGHVAQLCALRAELGAARHPLPSPPPAGEGRSQARGLAPLPPGRGRGGGERAHTPPGTSATFKQTSAMKRAGQNVTVFNALVDEGDAVTLRAFDTRDAAQSRAPQRACAACSCCR